MAEAKGKVCHYTEVPAVAVGEQGPGASLRWLIDDAHDGAPVYALRMVEIEPGGPLAASPARVRARELRRRGPRPRLHERRVARPEGGRRGVRAGRCRARVRQRRRHDVQVPVRDPGGEAQADYIGAVMRWRGAVLRDGRGGPARAVHGPGGGSGGGRADRGPGRSCRRGRHRQDLRALGSKRLARLCRGGQRTRPGGLHQGLRDGQPRVRRPHLAQHGVRVGIGGQAVHRSRASTCSRRTASSLSTIPCGSTCPSFPTSARQSSSGTC